MLGSQFCRTGVSLKQGDMQDWTLHHAGGRGVHRSEWHRGQPGMQLSPQPTRQQHPDGALLCKSYSLHAHDHNPLLCTGEIRDMCPTRVRAGNEGSLSSLSTPITEGLNDCILQIFLLLPQIEAASSPVLISKISLLTVGQQAIMDAYLCLLHLTTGTVQLCNACSAVAAECACRDHVLGAQGQSCIRPMVLLQCCT